MTQQTISILLNVFIAPCGPRFGLSLPAVEIYSFKAQYIFIQTTVTCIKLDGGGITIQYNFFVAVYLKKKSTRHNPTTTTSQHQQKQRKVKQQKQQQQ